MTFKLLVVLFLLSILVALIFYRPFLGYLSFVALLIARPQDARPTLEPLGIPQVVAIATIISSFLYDRTSRLSVLKCPQTSLFTLFYLSIIVSSFFAENIGMAQHRVHEFLVIYIFYLITIMIVNSQDRLKKSLYAIVIAGSYLPYIAIRYGGSMLPETSGGKIIRRLNLTEWNLNFGTSNYLGFAMVFMVCLSYGLILSENRNTVKVFLSTGIGVFVYTLIKTVSRWSTANLGFIAGYILLRSKKKSQILLAFVPVALIFMTLAPPEFFSRMESTLSYKEDVSARGRINAWGKGLGLWSNNFFLGVGPDNFQYHLSKSIEPGEFVADSAHNSYIQILVESGILGFITWFSLIAISIRDLIIAKKMIEPYRDRFSALFYYGLSLELSMVALLFQSISTSLGHREILYFTIALIVSYKHIVKGKLENWNLSPEDREPSP